MAINSISLSNTFGQWLITTQQLVSAANTLETGTYSKTGGTLAITSSVGTGLSVTNHTALSSVAISKEASIAGNCSISRTLTAANLTINAGGTSTTNSSIFVYRGVGATQGEMRWNEPNKRWQIRNITNLAYSNVVSESQVASVDGYGITKLVDSYTTNDITIAPTAAALKRLNDVVAAIPGGQAVTDAGNASNQANTAFLRANSAWFLANQANTKANTGGTFSGAVTVQGAFTYNSTLTGSSSVINIGSGQISKDPGGNVAIGLGSSTGGGTFFVRGIPGINRGVMIGNGGYSLYGAKSDNTNFDKMVLGGTDFAFLPLGVGGTGNVGIGTLTPDQKLVVEGNIDAVSYGIPSIGATSKSVVRSERFFITGSGQTVTLPATPTLGNEVTIGICGNFADTIVARNNKLIMGLAENMTIDKANVTVTLIYTNDTYGWRLF